jgi:cysteine desulfurase
MFFFRRKVYLDNNATTPVAAAARRRMNQVLKENYGNPSSLYRTARDSALVLEEARHAVALAINAESGEILFTGSATEANNQVLVSLFEKFYPQKDTIISSPIEHPAVLETLDYLEKRGARIKYCQVDRGGIADPAEIESLIDSKTFLAVLMLANNETGSIQPVGRTAELCHRKNILLLSDCVQALGKIPVDVKELGVDYATFSGHKIHGPKGAGALYVRSGCPIGSFIHGGHQENGLRAGTESLHNIAGLSCAFSQVGALLKKAESISGLKRSFLARLKEAAPEAVINSPRENCLPNTVSIAFPGINNAQLMAHLDFHGIAVSAGSACNTQSDKPSHVLSAMGLSEAQARETLRFSLSDKTEASDIKYTVKVLGNFLSGDANAISLISPAQLDEGLLLSEDTYILDVRFPTDRKILKGLPGSHEAPFLGFGKYAVRVPMNKNVIVVCQAGGNAPIIAYHLRSKGHRNVSFLISGLAGWKMIKPHLYQRYAGQNISSL